MSNKLEVYTSKGYSENGDRIFIGFGNMNPYNNKEVGGKNVLDKLGVINIYLSALDKKISELPITLAIKGKDGEDNKYLSAFAFSQSYSKEDGTLGFRQKMVINLDENTALWATRMPKHGYVFDNDKAGSNTSKIEAFNDLIKDGVSFTLGANKLETLSPHKELMENINKFDKSAMNVIEFEKGKGAVITEVRDISSKNVEVEAPAKKSPAKSAKEAIDKATTKASDKGGKEQ